MTGALLTLMRAKQFALQPKSVPATVTRPNEDPIETRGIWMTPVSEVGPLGLESQRADPRRVLALRRDEVPTVPRGTQIEAPDVVDGESMRWRVEGTERVEDADHTRVIVLPDPDA